MSAGRRVWPGRIARIAGALVVLAGAAGLVVAGTWLPDGTVDAPAQAPVAVPPAPARAVCAGPLVLPTATGGQFDPVPVPPVTTVTALSAPESGPSGAGAVLTLDGASSLATLGPAEPSAVLVEPGGPTVVGVASTDVAARVAGSTTALVTAGDLRGLAVASCTAPVSDAWLVGGSTAAGATTYLLLTNPGSTPVEAMLAVWGPNGPVELAAPVQLVAPGTQRTIDLGAIAPGERVTVVHVTATGGQLTAVLQDGALRGFTPAGVDLVVPGQPPALRQVVPGVVVEDSEPDDEDAPMLRLLAPGGAATTATVTLLGPDGPVDLPGAGTVDVPAGGVSGLSLGGLPAGAYTVVVDAGQPVVAAVVFTRVGEAGDLDASPRVERAWAASTDVGDGLVVPAADADATLVVGALPAQGDPTAEEAQPARGTLRLLDASGQVLRTSTVSVDAGSTGSWALADLVDDPSAVRGVELTWEDGSTVAAWAVLAERSQDDGTLVGLLEPVRTTAGSGEVAVREDPAVGLP